MNIKEFSSKHSLRLAKVECTAGNPNFLPDIEARHYQMTVTGLHGKAFREFFTVGMGWTKKPDLSDLLSCLAMDIQSIQGLPFREWFEELGFSSEASASRIYKTIKAQEARFQAFIGHEAFEEFLTVETD